MLAHGGTAALGMVSSGRAMPDARFRSAIAWKHLARDAFSTHTDENAAMAKKEAKKLDELFHDTLKDIYFAEKKILSTLPKMEKAAQAPQLKKAFVKHKTETEGHVTRLEKVFAAIFLAEAVAA